MCRVSCRVSCVLYALCHVRCACHAPWRYTLQAVLCRGVQVLLHMLRARGTLLLDDPGRFFEQRTTKNSCLWAAPRTSWSDGFVCSLLSLFSHISVGACNVRNTLRMVVWQEALEEYGFLARDTALACTASKAEEGDTSGNSAACATKLGCDRLQKGVFRVNCVDCLDRTNVAQSVCYLPRACVWSGWALDHDVALHGTVLARVVLGPSHGGLVAGMRLLLLIATCTADFAIANQLLSKVVVGGRNGRCWPWVLLCISCTPCRCAHARMWRPAWQPYLRNLPSPLRGPMPSTSRSLLSASCLSALGTCPPREFQTVARFAASTRKAIPVRER